ncbi:MAG: flagellar motor protein MotB [Planctomycetales bacterium]|nr:flagellar motor protein MotB [Planctomycetales bacterium]
MAKQADPDPPADLPPWLMTYSDVVTLLMTFFILLLTFATSEPESFDRMQVSMFGGGGATGIAGDKIKGMDRDALLVRERSRAGRITMRGSETPPVNTDPSYDSMTKGLAGLENAEERELATQHSVSLPLSLLVDSRGEISAVGHQHLRMLAQQLRKQELDVEFMVGDRQRIRDAVTLTSHMYQKEAIPPGRLGVGRDDSLDPSMVKIVLTRPIGREG